MKKKKYITLKNLNEGYDFRKIAGIMSDSGYKMNHATARNQLFISIEELLTNISSNLNIKMSKQSINDMINNQLLQDNLADILYLAYQNILKEKKNKKEGEYINNEQW